MSARAAAVAVCARLRADGHEALFAGGCVRDELLGVEPVDYDVATSARPERVLELWPNAHAVGIAFGVVVVAEGGHDVEVATFRSDDAYVDGRRPVSVTYGSARADAERRDFTINAMFLDPTTDRVIDYVDGRDDLTAWRLRTVGDPVARFTEDKLRVLRAVRFAAHYGLDVDPTLVAAARSLAPELGVVSAERITAELARMWTGGAPARAAALLVAWDVLPVVFPEAVGDDELAARLAALSPRPDAVLGWAAASWRAGDDALDRFRLSNAVRAAIRSIHDLARAMPDFPAASVATRKRIVRDPHVDAALRLARSTGTETSTIDRVVRAKKTWDDVDLHPPRFLDGDAIAALGVARGPAIGRALDALETEALEGRVPDRAAAEAFVRRLVADS